MGRISSPQKTSILHRLSQAGAPSVKVISKETGVTSATIYQWLYQSRKLKQHGYTSNLGATMSKKKQSRISPTEKLEIIADTARLQGQGLADYCSKRGITQDELAIWRDQALNGLETFTHATTMVSEEEHRKLKVEIQRQNEALAEACAIIVLQKKTSRLLGGEK
jgi:transposase